MTIRRIPTLALLMAGLSVVTACSREPAADKPAAPAVTFKPVPPGGTAATGAPSAPQVGVPGGPAAMVTDMASGWPITLQVGQDVMVRLAADRAAGMGWKQKASTDLLSAPAEPTFEPGGAAGGTEVYRVKAVKPGEAKLTFEYRKTADPNAAPARTVTYTVTVR